MQRMKRLQELANRIPIRWRLTLISLGLLTLLLSALGVIILFTADQALLTNQATALRYEAHLATDGLKGHPFGLSRPPGPPPGPPPLPDAGQCDQRQLCQRRLTDGGPAGPGAVGVCLRCANLRRPARQCAGGQGGEFGCPGSGPRGLGDMPDRRGHRADGGGADFAGVSQ